ncbi:ANTAR domain-containing protein [Kribbella sp. NBC_00382]|uniref:ANTAR domain-containing protein n=1 Tax=Kribbella sp. NBC_00382 TaxID=2975967 RepID=UPI002E1A0B27
MTAELLTIVQELAEVSRLVDGDDVPATLDRFVARMVATIPDCDEASIAICGDDAAPELVARSAAPTDPTVDPARLMLAEQLERRDGPLHEALTYAEPRRIDDAASDHRWPEVGAAVINAGYRSGLFLPLPARRDAAISLLSAKADAFGGTSYDIALLFTLHAGVTFDNAQLFHDSKALVAQLNAALDTRGLIGRAQGIVMRHYGVDTKTSFAILKRGSQNTNVKLRVLAQTIVDGQEGAALSQTLADFGLGQGSPAPGPR